MNRNRSLIAGIVALVIVTATISFVASAAVFFGWNYFNPKYEISFSPENVDAENIRKFNTVRKILKEDYYKDVDENTLLEGSISGMADSLGDPYTVYFTKDQMKTFMEKSGGSYVGIGVSITLDENGLLTIVEPFEDSPAKKAGIIKGDKIIKVDGKDVTQIRDEDLIISMIKGEENTNVKVTVYRPAKGISIDFDIVRQRIKVVNIRSEILEGDIGYIRIIMFDSEIAAFFEQHLNELLQQGVKSLVIDLRDNPGGSYEQVVSIADRLLPQGLIVYTEDKYKNKKVEKSDKDELGLPMVVLVNENSASASEILAGALKDHNKATLIGTKTFGKGLVQSVIPLADGSGLKVTIAKYYTPSGVCIQDIGIQPHEEIQLPEEFRNLPVSQLQRNEDIQMQRAIEMLK